MRTLLFALVFLTSAPTPCFAAGHHQGGAAAPASDPATPAGSADPAKGAGVDLQKLCSSNQNQKDPFAADQPLPPANRTATPRSPSTGAASAAAVTTPEISDQDADGFQFGICDKVRTAAAANAANCDRSLGKTFQLFTNEQHALQQLRADITRTLPSRLQGCSAGQTQAQQCTHDLYNEVAGKFQALSDKFGRHATLLESLHITLKDNSNTVLNGNGSTGRPFSPAIKTAGAHLLAQAEANAPRVSTLRTSTERPCPTNMSDPNTPFCGLLAGSAETRYFGKVFVSAQKMAADTAKCYMGNAQKAKANADGGGGAGSGKGNGSGDSTVTGKTGMGLDDLMKLATLGMTGAGLYCTVTKSCSPSSSSDASTNTDTAASGATSPTPNSTAASNGPQTSSLGENKGASSSPLGSTASAPETSASVGREGASTGYDQALQHFNGSLDSRAPASGSSPASSGASGGGGSFAGIGGSSGAGSPAPLATDLPKQSDGSGNGVGGGGLANGGGAGGFSLDSKAAPADSALKNILNGELPTSTDASLSALGDPSGATQATADNATDPENLFVRTKDAHVRCLKRGCVGQGVGENI